MFASKILEEKVKIIEEKLLEQQVGISKKIHDFMKQIGDGKNKITDLELDLSRAEK